MSSTKKQTLVIGADIGGTHITSALIDLEEGCTISDSRVRYVVDPNGSAEEILTIWEAAIKAVMLSIPQHLKNVGVAMPGPFDYPAGICLIRDMHKYEALYGLNIRDILSERLKIKPENIVFRNDAEAFLHGEVFCGAAKGYKNCFGITLGTGLGSAFSINGITADAELGVSPFCEGIAEDYLSTRWFVKRYFELTGKKVKDVKILADLASKDADSKSVFQEFGQNLGEFINRVMLTRKTEIIVIGGNITLAHSLFWPQLVAALKTENPDVILTRTQLGEDASLIGAVCEFEIEKREEVFNKSVTNL